MEGEREDGRRRKEQSLVFLLQGHPTSSYYTTDSFYITKTVAPLTLNLSCISGPSSNTLLLRPGSCFVIRLVFRYVDSRAWAVIT